MLKCPKCGNVMDLRQDGQGPISCGACGEKGTVLSFDTDEPREGDYITDDHILWYEHGTGKVLLNTRDQRDIYSPADNWREQVLEDMESRQFWPDAWMVSDHGNTHRIDLGLGD